MITLIVGFFLGVLAAVFLIWLTGTLADGVQRAEQRALTDLAQQARDHGDGPSTTYWLGNQPISRREYYLLGGR